MGYVSNDYDFIVFVFFDVFYSLFFYEVIGY